MGLLVRRAGRGRGALEWARGMGAGHGRGATAQGERTALLKATCSRAARPVLALARAQPVSHRRRSAQATCPLVG